MAELIPLEYRINLTRKTYIRRWGIAIALAGCIAGAGLANAYTWQQRQAHEYAVLDKEYVNKSVLIKQAMDLQAKRLDLAARMQKMQSLRDDKTLLSLLKNVSSGFSDKDCLQYINILAHSNQKSAQDKGDKGDNADYSVHLVGITSDYTTHANLLDRLTEVGANSEPRMSLPPDSTRIEKYKDGEVIHFEIVGEKPRPKSN